MRREEGKGTGGGKEYTLTFSRHFLDTHKANMITYLCEFECII